ncbi:hypothetical protein L618_002000000260 [Rhodococcus rhodochrous J45]|uniref:Uncharacterized protein n=1 Tax=Rhodococcus rhodochrous J45 TaxID=935266 RepID=A0A562E3T6_RHORH|nr:hypothetical protein L618_002000000260 [Rhodococcus rhodochrous J45]
MPHTGWPMVTVSPGTSMSVMLQTMVVSVGPYALYIRRPGAQRATSSGGHASPATVTASHSTPVGSTDASAAGVENRWVTRSRRSSAASSSPP